MMGLDEDSVLQDASGGGGGGGGGGSENVEIECAEERVREEMGSRSNFGQPVRGRREELAAASTMRAW
jgi:hypothetical protein